MEMLEVKKKRKIIPERKNVFDRPIAVLQPRKKIALENPSREIIPIKTQRELRVENVTESSIQDLILNGPTQYQWIFQKR